MAKRTPKASPLPYASPSGEKRALFIGISTVLLIVAVVFSLVLSIACLSKGAADRQQLDTLRQRLGTLQDQVTAMTTVATRTEQHLGAVEDRLNKAVPCPHAKSKNVCKW